jgi:hypothetical protein
VPGLLLGIPCDLWEDPIANKPNMGRKSGVGGAASSTGFIGFGAFASSANPAAAQTEDAAGADASSGTSTTAERPLPPFYAGSDSELALICKRLAKKDTITKLKALQQLQTYTIDESVLFGFLPHWVFLYSRLSLDDDRRVREALNNTLQAVLIVDRKAVAQYLVQLMGPWALAMADTANEVAAAAKRAFEIVYPVPKKRAGLMQTHRSTILKHISDTLKLPPAELSEPSGSASEERHERVTVACLGALAQTLRGSEYQNTVGTGEDALIGDSLLAALQSPNLLFRRAAAEALCAGTTDYDFSNMHTRLAVIANTYCIR